MKLVQVYLMGGGVMQLIVTTKVADYLPIRFQELHNNNPNKIIEVGVTADNGAEYAFSWGQVVGILVVAIPAPPIQGTIGQPNRSGI